MDGTILGKKYDLMGQGGGGGGTTNYNALENKPQINDVTLSGNKSLSDLGIASASAVSTLSGTVGSIAETVGDNNSGLVKSVNDIDSLIPSSATTSNKLATMSDIPSSGGGAIYSSTEQIAGEWNGKTLYRKLFDVEAHGVEWDTTLDGDTPVDFALFECGYIAKTGGDETKYINANYYDANNHAFCYVSVNNDRLHCIEAHSGNLWPSGARVVMSVLYTKKTVSSSKKGGKK